jgi:hypothetical protein
VVLAEGVSTNGTLVSNHTNQKPHKQVRWFYLPLKTNEAIFWSLGQKVKKDKLCQNFKLRTTFSLRSVSQVKLWTTKIP